MEVRRPCRRSKQTPPLLWFVRWRWCAYSFIRIYTRHHHHNNVELMIPEDLCRSMAPARHCTGSSLYHQDHLFTRTTTGNNTRILSKLALIYSSFATSLPLNATAIIRPWSIVACRGHGEGESEELKLVLCAIRNGTILTIRDPVAWRHYPYLHFSTKRDFDVVEDGCADGDRFLLNMLRFYDLMQVSRTADLVKLKREIKK